MGQFQDFPLPDGSYADDTRPWSQQDIINYIPTFAEASGTRSRIKYRVVPGLQTFANVGTGPHRASRDVEGKLFVVSGTTLYQVAPDGTATSKGTIPGTGFVSMTHNQIDGGNQLVIGTRDNSYVYNTVTGALAATGVGLLSVDFLNQRILGVDTQRRFWRYSALADATSWSDLDNESAESSPDRIVGGIVSQGEWLVFGERTIEVWANSPTENTAFQRGEVIERGCLNANTIRRLDNTAFFVDNNAIPCRLNGYQPMPIAPKSIVAELRACDPAKLFAFTWEDNGYVVYYLTAQDGRTWGYDVTSGKWHRRESFGLDRWRLNTLTKWNGDWYGGDYASGKLYKLRSGYVYEGCEIMPRGLRSGVMHGNGNRVFLHGFKLALQTGGVDSTVDEGAVAPTITGNLPDATVGDVIHYQYTITRAYPGQQVTLTLTGALPTGLSIDATGLVTGTVTTAGTFSWSITPSGECATGDALADGAVVADTLASAIIADAPILYWKLNETSGTVAADSSGHNRTGTITGTPTLSSSGLTLVNASDGVLGPVDNALCVAQDTGWAHEAIVTRYGAGGSAAEIIMAEWVSSNFGYHSGSLQFAGTGDVDAGKPRVNFTTAVSHTEVKVTGSSVAALATRTHWMGVRRLGTGGAMNFTLYKNGMQVAQDTTSAETLLADATTTLAFVVGAPGASYYPASYALNAKVEHVAVYDQPITAARVLYHAQKAGLA